MEVAIGIDELKWYGRTVQPYVIPLRKLLKAKCLTAYCKDLQFVDFALRVGDAQGGVGRASINKRAKSIGINIFLDITPHQPQNEIPPIISSLIREAAKKIAKKMATAVEGSNPDQFLKDVNSALDEYDAGLSVEEPEGNRAE